MACSLVNGMSLIRSSCDCFLFHQRELEFVLKSFEYQTVQSTIQMLHSTRTVSLDALSESHQHTAQVSQRKTGAGQDCQMTQGAFIPVSAPREALLNDQQLNNRETDEAQGTRKQREDHGELMITACTRSILQKLI